MSLVAIGRSIFLVLKLFWIEVSAKVLGGGADSKTYIDWALKSRSTRERNILLRQAIRLAERELSVERILLALNKIDFRNLALKDYAIVRMHRSLIEAAAWAGTEREYTLAKQVALESGLCQESRAQIFTPQVRELMTWRECGAGAVNTNISSGIDYSTTHFPYIYYWLMFEAARTQGQEDEAHAWLDLAARTVPEDDPKRNIILGMWRLNYSSEECRGDLEG